MSKLLIIGASGFLGSKLFEMFSSEYEVIGTYSNHPVPGLVHLDITNKRAVDKLITSEKPDIIVHTVAMIDPDLCEKNKKQAEDINYHGTENIIAAAKTIQAKLIYISTVYVFDGEKGDYKENDPTHAVNWYGTTKRKAEQAIQHYPNHIIIRFDILYGYNGKNLQNGLFAKILSGKPLEVNADQVRQPVWVDDVGYAIRILLEKNFSGIIHLAGPNSISKYELSKKLESIIREKSSLIPVPEKEQIARRPKDVSLNVSFAKSLGISFTSINEAVEKIKAQMQ